MTTLTYQARTFSPPLRTKKSSKPMTNNDKVQRVFDFDLDRMQQRVADEGMEVPNFDNKQDLLAWINGK